MGSPLPEGAGPEQIERHLSALNEQAQQRYRDAVETRKKLTTVTASAESDGGVVRVTVTSTGALSELVLGEEARKWAPTETAAKVLRCAQRAQARIADVAQDVLTEGLGDSEKPITDLVVGQLRSGFPEPEPEQSAWSRPERPPVEKPATDEDYFTDQGFLRNRSDEEGTRA